MTLEQHSDAPSPPPSSTSRAAELVFVSGNTGKLASVARLLDPVRVRCVVLDLHEIQHVSVLEVARRKALEAYDVLGVPVFAEDGGLVIDGCGGFPGALTKPVLDSLGLDRLVAVAGVLPCVAWFESAVAYVDADGTAEFAGRSRSGHLMPPQDVELPDGAWSDLWRSFRPDGAPGVLATLPADSPWCRPSQDSPMTKFASWVHQR